MLMPKTTGMAKKKILISDHMRISDRLDYLTVDYAARLAVGL